MKKKLIIIALFALTIIPLMSSKNVNAFVNKSQISDCEEFYSKDYFNLSPDITREVIEHANTFKIEYKINSELEVLNYTQSFITDNDSVLVKFQNLNNDKFEVFINISSIGVYQIEIISTVVLADHNLIVLKDKLFIYATEEYDFISTASIDDAKFYCYEYMTKTTNPNYADYDKFFNLQTKTSLLANNNDTANYSINALSNIYISGYITWSSREGTVNNAINVKVEIIDVDLFGINDVLETVYTNSNGYYSASVSNTGFLENGGKDIKIRVSATGGNIKVVNNSNSVYSIDSGIIENFTGTSLSINMFIDVNTLTNIDADRVTAFRVHQAMNFGAGYVGSKKGNRLDSISVVYPTSQSTSFYNGSKIHILQDDCDDWDVILHEYGHYVQDYYNISESPGGTHYTGECLNARLGKDKGMKLAWGEGWATYFSVSAQVEMNASSFNIANVGDMNYTDAVDSTIDYSLESPTLYYYSYGESNEIAVAAALFDLADPLNDDSVNLGYTYIWNIINNAQCSDFSEFMNELQTLNYNFEYLKIGEVLSDLDISPELVSPSNYQTTGWTTLNFSWIANGGSGNYANNKFSIVFFNKNKQFIYETPTTTNLNYQLTSAEWTTLLNSSTEYVYWAVKAYQTKDFETGYYYSDYRTLYLPSIFQIFLDQEKYDWIDTGDCAWFEFIAPKTGNYNIYTVGNFDSYLEIYNSFYALIDRDGSFLNDDDNGVGTNASLIIGLEKNQKIYIRISHYNWSSSGGTTLKIEEDLQEQIDLDCRDAQTSYTKYVNKCQYLIYELIVDCPKTYNFTITAPNAIDIKLYDSSMKLVNVSATMYNNNFEGNLSTYLNVGKYYLVIKYSNIALSGSITITFETAWPTQNYQVLFSNTLNKNNVLTHLHKTDTEIYKNQLYYINNNGAGYYKFELNGTTKDGSIISYPQGAITIYDSVSKTTPMDKYTIPGYTNQAKSFENINNIIVYLPRNGYFYIDINMSTNNLSSLYLDITDVDSQTVNLFNLSETANQTINIFDNLSTNGDVVKKVNIINAGKFNIGIDYTGTQISNMYFLITKVTLNSNNTYSVTTCVMDVVNYQNLNSVITVNLEDGLYYIALLNGTQLSSSINITMERIVTQSGSHVLVADPDQYTPTGSEISIIEKDYIYKSYRGNIITKNFTRIIYPDYNYGISPSRLDYYWYSSDNNIATVTDYGTVLGNSTGTVKIMAVLKSDPSKVFVKEFIVVNDTGTELIEVNNTFVIKYSNTNGHFLLDLTIINCPFPWIQDYFWTITESTMTASMDYWGYISVNSTGQIKIRGIYSKNSRVIVYITINVI